MKFLSAFAPLALLASALAVPAPLAKRAPSAKKGVGYNDEALTRNVDVSWVYNWSPTQNGELTAGVQFVPMLWSDNAGTWLTDAQAAIDNGSTHLLGFNEPDLNSRPSPSASVRSSFYRSRWLPSAESNMTPEQAATAWKQYMSPFWGKAALVSPAVTNGGAPMGTAWLQSFEAACPDCWFQVSAVALHWYDAAWNTGYFTNYLTEAHNLWPDKKIWLTEFAGSGTSEEQQTFLQTVIPWMEQQDWIERYAGFGDFAGNYVNADGSLTALGQVYSDTV